MNETSKPTLEGERGSVVSANLETQMAALYGISVEKYREIFRPFQGAPNGGIGFPTIAERDAFERSIGKTPWRPMPTVARKRTARA